MLVHPSTTESAAASLPAAARNLSWHLSAVRGSVGISFVRLTDARLTLLELLVVLVNARHGDRESGGKSASTGTHRWERIDHPSEN